MNDEILRKLKKVLRILFLVVVGLILFFIATGIYFFSASLEPSGKMRQKTFMPSPAQVFEGGFGRGADGVNVALPDASVGGGGVIPDYENDAASSVVAPTPAIPASERKLIQNGALSLVVNRVEDALTDLVSIAEKLGGRIDSETVYNSGDAAKKQATVVMKVPAVNFSAAMEQSKGIARKVESENISTEDITEKFIDMQARLKNLKAEEEQYLEIMKKALKIDDILKVSQKLYAVRQQIEQLQGQMNYLSRHVDMSVITINLSSEPDIKPTEVIWSPSTTMKEAMKGLIDGFYTFLKYVILFVGYFLPLTILFGSSILLLVWLIWKLSLFMKKRIDVMLK
jgi:hypothetical protein